MDWKFKEINVGDVVRVNMGSYYHYGVCTADDRIVQFGLPILNPNEKDVEVCATDINTFLCGRFAEVMVLNKKEEKQKNDVKTIVEKAENSIGEKGYNLLHNNCEHFANRCVFNVGKSNQVENIQKQMFNKITPKEIYVAPIEMFKNNEILPKYTKKEFGKITNEKVKRKKFSAYGLLKYAVEKSFRIVENFENFKKTKNGKPVCKDYCFSISHTDELVAVGVSKCNLGVDIEFVDKSKGVELLKNAMLENEETFQIASHKDVFSVWTKKEAIFKFIEGKTFEPKKININSASTKTFCFSHNEKDYVLSVASEDIGNTKLINLCDDK